MNEVRRSFLGSYRAVGPLLRSVEVARSWDSASALLGFSVRGLAGHLVRAGGGVLHYVGETEPRGEEPIEAPAYYATVLARMDDDAHRDVIARGEANAAEGPEALAASHRVTTERLEEVLARVPDGRLVRVFADLVMQLDDYLVTRLVEVLVHGDDLAVSVGAATPPADPRAAGMAIGHLVEVARLRHGDRAVLTALSRRERDDLEALRVF